VSFFSRVESRIVHAAQDPRSLGCRQELRRGLGRRARWPRRRPQAAVTVDPMLQRRTISMRGNPESS
jgi:hypothetical protein